MTVEQPGPQGPVVGIDLGKTGLRARLDAPGSSAHGRQTESSGTRGLAEQGGGEAAYAAIVGALDRLTRDVRPSAVAVGAAGAAAAPDATRELARRLATGAGCPVAVTNDAITSHVGALAGQPGVVLSAGTGAATVGVGHDGAVVVIDGWGQWLGDDGSGTWIGRAGLVAALRALDGRGPRTSLTTLARDHFGELGTLPARLSLDGAHTVRDTASFAPVVASAAGDGDVVAATVTTRAGRHLAAAIEAAAERSATARVALVGGLVRLGPVLLDPLHEALPPSLVVVAASGTSLDGAVLLARRRDLPHEPAVTRHAPVRSVPPGAAGRGPTAAGSANDAVPTDLREDRPR